MRELVAATPWMDGCYLIMVTASPHLEEAGLGARAAHPMDLRQDIVNLNAKGIWGDGGRQGVGYKLRGFSVFWVAGLS